MVLGSWYRGAVKKKRHNFVRSTVNFGQWQQLEENCPDVLTDFCPRSVPLTAANSSVAPVIGTISGNIAQQR